MRINTKSLPLYILYIFILVILLSQKTNLHEDELYTYGLSNNPYDETITFAFEDGVKYMPADTPYLSYVATTDDTRFDYEEVWINQEHDVHPPLYYILIHTICSLFPWKFSIWFAGAVNILFACLTLYVLRKLMDKLDATPETKNILSVLFLFQSGMWDIATFLRMYTMTVFWVVLITYLLVQYLDKTKIEPTDLIALGLVLICGVLTHYYFIVYAFFIYFVFCLISFLQKKYRKVLQAVITAICSAIASVIIFPAMLNHIFIDKGDRGEQSFNNLLDNSWEKYLSQIKIFTKLLDQRLTGGGLFLFLAIILLLLLTYHLIKKHAKIELEQVGKWLLILIPSLCYFFLICKIAVLNTDRYTALIYPNIFLLLYLGGATIIQHYCKKNTYRIIMIICVIIININQIRSFNGTYLYSDSSELLASSEELGDKDCVCLYSKRWKLHPAFFELKNYQSVTFYPFADIMEDHDIPDELITKKDYILCITDDYIIEDVIECLNSSGFAIDNYTKLGTHQYTSSYHIIK